MRKALLDNGLTVLASHMPSTRSVTVAVFVGAGSRYEDERVAGISHFIEHMVFKGTERWPTAREISEAVEGVGGVMNASTDHEMTVFWCKVASHHFPRAVEVLADMMLRPLFNPEEVEKERQVILEELRMTNDVPSHKAGLLLDQALWPGHPLGRDVGGTPESVSRITRDDLLGYMRRQYVARNAVVSVAGDVPPEEAVGAVGRAFAPWGSGGDLIPWYPYTGPHTSGEVRFERRRTEQAHIYVGFHTVGLEHPDRFAVNLASSVLGEGMSSRLFVKLREERALVYDVHSSVTFLKDCGALAVYCGTEPPRAEEALRAVREEVEGLARGIPEEELAKAREFLKGRLLLRMEDSRSVAMWNGAQQLLTGRVRSVDEVIEGLEAVSAEQVAEVARRYLAPSRANLALVGPYRGVARLARAVGIPYRAGRK